MSDFYDLTPDEQAVPLTDLARRAVECWDLGGEPRIRLIKCRENAVFALESEAARVVMRVHRAGYHSPEALESELQWMNELRRSGIATPEVVPSRDGRLFQVVECDGVPEGRLVDVLSWVDGEPLGSLEGGVDPGEQSRKAFFETGRLMARLHNHAQGWQLPDSFTRHAWDAEGLLGDEPLWGRFWELEALDPAGRNLVLAARDRARGDLAEFGDTEDRYGLIHADFLPENLLVDQGRIQLIDFDDAGFGWHLFDIATSLFVVADSPDFEAILDAFVSGYRTERELPEAHLAQLPLFFLLRGLTYLGWLHTRKETETAKELTPMMVAAVTELAAEYLASTTTDDDTVETVLATLVEGEANWARTDAAARRDLLNRFGDLVAESAEEWVAIAASIKGLPESSPLVGEEWITGPWATLGSARALAHTLDRLSSGANVIDGVTLRTAPGHRVTVPVLPANKYDSLLLSGFSAEVWMRPGVTEDEVRDNAGLGSRTPHATQGIALVLGAGNIFSIAPLDVLHALHADNRAVVLKLNPVTDRLLPVFERILAPYVELGVVQIVTGGAELGSAFAYDSRVSAVHMTGSEQTHDVIVWGPGESGATARATGSPQLTKPITSELGGVGPVIVVPGNWSPADLRFQAEHVATQRLHNAGSNCVAGQVVIVSSDWTQKEEFLTELRRVLAEAPKRPVWYPGGQERIEAARTTHHAECTTLGAQQDRILIEGLDLSDPNEPAFTTEYFAPVLAVAELPGHGLDFLRTATHAANEALRGTLGANIIIDPKTLKSIGAAFEETLADLRYGTIGVNAWTGVGYLTAHATWGAFPGHTIDDVQSGIGVVHNAFLLEKTERTVVRGPFRPSPRSILHGEWSLSPRPPWFVTNRTAATTGRRLVSFAARPRIAALPAIFASALRG